MVTDIPREGHTEGVGMTSAGFTSIGIVLLLLLALLSALHVRGPVPRLDGRYTFLLSSEQPRSRCCD